MYIRTRYPQRVARLVQKVLCSVSLYALLSCCRRFGVAWCAAPSWRLLSSARSPITTIRNTFSSSHSRLRYKSRTRCCAATYPKIAFRKDNVRSNVANFEGTKVASLASFCGCAYAKQKRIECDVTALFCDGYDEMFVPNCVPFFRQVTNPLFLGY